MSPLTGNELAKVTADSAPSTNASASLAAIAATALAVTLVATATASLSHSSFSPCPHSPSGVELCIPASFPAFQCSIKLSTDP